VGIFAVVSTIFVGGCNYGASGKQAIQDEFDGYKEQQIALLTQVTEANRKDAIKANDRLKAEERALEQRDVRHKAELAKIRKELDAVKLDARLVRLFNDSATSNGTDQPTPRPEVSADGEADASPTPDPTLGDLAEVILENNKNHLACIAQVKEWHTFYNNLYGSFE